MHKSLLSIASLALLATTFGSAQQADKQPGQRVGKRTGKGTGKGTGEGCSLEAEVRRGESFTHAGPAGLDFMLEAIPSGWIVRMLRHGVPRGEFDYAGLATPPYMSPNPILISTDFAFRAQDAVGWNPRHFQYFRTEKEFQQGIAAYRELVSAPAEHPTAVSQAGMNRLLQLSSQAAAAEIEILDAHLVGGTANQTQAAALVSSHFLQTPHVVDPVAGGGPATPLGSIESLRFRVTFLKTSCPSSKK